jgi:hypothetical protein
VIDNKVSMDVESITLGRLLELFDRATGLESTVPPALANRTLSVKFEGLTFDDAVRKIFEGQPIDYVVVGRQGIMVTALSQPGGPESSPTPAYNPVPPQIEQQSFLGEDQPAPSFPPPQAVPGMPVPVPGAAPGAVPNNNPFNQQQQPAVIQTPFGPIPNPRAGQPIQNGLPTGQPTQPSPFGNAVPVTPATPFGTMPQPPAQPNNNIFGNTSPPLFNQNQK